VCANLSVVFAIVSVSPVKLYYCYKDIYIIDIIIISIMG